MNNHAWLQCRHPYSSLQAITSEKYLHADKLHYSNLAVMYRDISIEPCDSSQEIQGRLLELQLELQSSSQASKSLQTATAEILQLQRYETHVPKSYYLLLIHFLVITRLQTG